MMIMPLNRRASSTYDPVTELFGASEYGDIWLNDPAYYFTDAACSTAVTATGDTVLGWKGAANDTIFPSIATKGMLYQEDGSGNAYLDSDETDDYFRNTTLNLRFKTFDVAMGFNPTAVDFIVLSHNATNAPWVGIGQSGSSNTALVSAGAPGVTQNALYWDNSLSSDTTRGQQFTSAQSASRVLINTTIDNLGDWNPTIGDYNAAGLYHVPGLLGPVLIRQGTMTSDQRAAFDTWLSAQGPV